MQYIPIISEKDLVLDQNKRIMPNGKIEILDPVSTNPIDVYTYDSQNNRYVVATNPIYLDVESRPQHTYFVKQLAYCRLSKYLGEFTDPITHSAISNYEFVRDWYGAFSADDAKNDTIISGITALGEANTELGKVTVVGYWTDKDCEARTYVWDPNCTQDPDGGYIIKNNDLDTGRWILMFDGEYIPSTYYGVYPGRESTMNALLNYVATVGTAQKPTAPGVYFAPGYYTAATTDLVTSKKVLLDADTQFTRNTFEVGDLKVIGSATHWICDFIIDNPNAEAHSSWFRTLAWFYMCRAKTYYYDSTNYFTDSNVNYSYELNQKNIIGTSRLPATYGANGLLRLVNCNIKGTKLWNNSDKLYFASCDFKDEWFLNPANIDFVNNVYARSVGLCNLNLSNFTSTTAYINAQGANGATVLDLEGRTVTSISFPASVTELRNAFCTNLSINKTGAVDIWLKNVVASNASIAARYITIEKGSDINFNNEPSFDAMWCNDSKINAQTIWYSKKQIIMNNCWVGITFQRVTDNTSTEAVLEFINCEFQTNVGIQSKSLIMHNCRTSNNTIKIYPYKQDDVYKMFVDLQGNTFNNSSPIEFTKFNDDNCYEVVASWTIVNNSFYGNDEGLRCRYWQNRVGSNYNKTFIKCSTDTVIEYAGNVGKCPADNPKGLMISDNTSYMTESITQGGETFTLYKYTGASMRICPKFSNNVWWMVSYPGKVCHAQKYYNWVNSPYDSLTYSLFNQQLYYYPYGHDWQDRDSDFFRLTPCTFNDYIRIVQRGDGDHNQGIVCHVV